MNTQNTQIHQPLVSVMIPYYNCQDYIAETIESVEQQTYPNVEIIIVNDGSAQEHTDYLKQLLLNKPHVQYYFQQNKGLAATRNAAAQYAKGTYFLFLDADDVILPTYVEQSVALLEQNQDYQVVYPISEYFGAKTGIWELPPYHQYQDLLLTNRLPCIAVHRAEDFHRIGGFDDSLPTHEDWDYWIRLLAKGGQVYQIPMVLFRYRQRENFSSLINKLQANPHLLRADIQRVYLKNSEIFAQNQLGYLDLLNFYWDSQYFQKQNDILLKNNEEQEQLLIEKQKLIVETEAQKQQQKVESERIIQHLNMTIHHLNQDIDELQLRWQKYQKLNVIKLFKPLIKFETALKSANQYRKLFRQLVKEKGNFTSAYHTCRKVQQEHGLKGVKKFLKNRFNTERKASKVSIKELSLKDSWVILTTQHTYYIAQLLSQSLKKIDVDSEIIFDMPIDGYSDKWHIVICPQIFQQLPEHYLAFQMEQSVSSRWFTDEYFERLRGAEYIFDYSMQNIHFLHQNGFPFSQVYYLPIGLLPYQDDSVLEENFEYDVVFYGTPHCERRQLFLSKLSEHFSVKIVSEVFGDELYEVLKKAKVIVNIHYYENALLETTRLYECLSLNRIVVSEMGSDQSEHNQLADLIDFTAVGNIDAMVERVQYWLSNSEALMQRKQAIAQACHKVSQFDFYFYRFLLAQDLIEFNQFYDLCAEYVQPTGDFWCLSLPESVARRQDFNKDNQYNAWVFTGLRHKIGWIGCGLSYKFMLKTAERLGLPQVSICEDDVLFNPEFGKRYETIKQDLAQYTESWDVFSGLVSDLSNTAEISSVLIESSGEKYYSINKLVSMVFNIYHQSSYAKIYSWDYHQRTTDNTIDRYIESYGGLKGLIVSPFLVGHKEELSSTLWGSSNTIYKDMIDRSQKLLDAKIAEL